jgi:LysR family hydrogen peroxide-inducible transcriptional activator
MPPAHATDPAATASAASPTALVFTLRQLQYAQAVAEELSFRRAAVRCHVSQPALSAQLAQLEEALGVRLFERDRRRVLVTTAGREVLARAREVLLNAADLGESARRVADPLAGTLRIGVIPTIAPYLLPQVAPRLRERFRQLTLLWLEDKTAALVESLAAGRLDAMLIALGPDLGDVEHETLAEDPFVLAAPPGHPLGRGDSPASLAELRGGDVLLLDEGHCLRQQALELCARAKAHELAFRATSLGTLVQMVAAGAGVTLLPALALETEARRARLQLRRFAPPAPGRTIVLAWRKRTPLGPALRELTSVARECYPSPALPRSAPRRRSHGTH